MSVTSPVPDLIDIPDLCRWLGISHVTAQHWRSRREGPPFIKVGKAIRYRRSDVEAWLASNAVATTKGA